MIYRFKRYFFFNFGQICVGSDLAKLIKSRNNVFSQRNERREREQREMAKLAAKEAGIGSDEGSSRISRSHSITDSDTYTQVWSQSYSGALCTLKSQKLPISAIFISCHTFFFFSSRTKPN